MTRDENMLARAGEYVLGTMSAEERRRVEAELATDDSLRQAIEDFAAKMYALDDAAPPALVPAGMWGAIDARLGNEAADGNATADVVAFPVRQSRRAMNWQMPALAASLLVAAAIGFIAGRTTGVSQQPTVLVVLQTADETPGAIFEAFADNSVRIVPLENFAVPDGKILQVWTLYDKGVGPVSLGTLTKSETATLAGADLPVPVAEQLYEITLEDSPGSPTGKPTGPILVKGFAKRPAGA